MKILHITDSHATVKGPESRNDIYYIAFLKKMYELGFVVKRNNIDIVVHTGDLFHTARVSDKFAGQVSEMIKAMGVPFYVVPGNHDIEGYTTDTIDQTKLGLLAKTGVVRLLDRDNPVRIDCEQGGEEFTVAISGQEYYKDIDTGNMEDFEMQQDDADLNILAIHGYITDTPQHPDIKYTMCKDIVSDADIILTGHYHRQFEWSDGQNLDIYNPGSMMRVEQTDYNKTHTPQYGILDVSLDENGYITWDYSFHKFRTAQPSTVIFDYAAKYKAKHTSITLDGFKNSIANTMTQVNTASSNIQQIITDLCTKGNIEADIEKAAMDIYNNALQSTPDKLEAPQGFVEDNSNKKIVKVILDNFQSHGHTEIDLDDGLNIIVGESNHGKTAILRGIMWAVTNQPLGNDFIMAGQDECSVTVCYNDGTSIKRGRTMKDTGYYDIYYHDDNGTLQRGQYRGFTNAVPVEVANVHQMPKVNITKDIETHLNVLSQLDGPFLLTESPTVKAAAIGRITGTHVIDAGIKDTNKAIQANRKAIKLYKADIGEKENELQKMPNVDLMEEISKLSNAIIDYAESLDDKCEKMNNALSSIAKINKEIALNEVEVVKCRTIASLSNIVDDGIGKLSNFKHLDELFRSYFATVHEEAAQEDIAEKLKSIIRIKPIVDMTIIKLNKVNELNSLYNEFNNVSYDIVTAHRNRIINKEYSSYLNGIIDHCEELYKCCYDCSTHISKIVDIDTEIDKENKVLISSNIFIKSLNKDISDVQKNKNKFIIGNGLCPCCGQVIDDSHVSSITKFMEVI